MLRTAQQRRLDGRYPWRWFDEAALIWELGSRVGSQNELGKSCALLRGLILVISHLL